MGEHAGIFEVPKKELSVATGMEEIICSADEVVRSERKNRKELGVPVDLLRYTIPYPQIKKIAAIKNHIWGL